MSEFPESSGYINAKDLDGKKVILNTLDGNGDVEQREMTMKIRGDAKSHGKDSPDKEIRVVIETEHPETGEPILIPTRANESTVNDSLNKATVGYNRRFAKGWDEVFGQN